jgi:L-ascorbate metabolism protein UlaG (beta-lactamase superfamily)
MAITIEWLGHSCFRLRGANGPSILIDPYDDSIGYRVPAYKCDVLIITHTHYDSSAEQLVEGEYTVVNTKGTTLVGDIAFNAIPWWHDDSNGKEYGSVLVMLFELDGIKIGYLSHIGSVPQSWVLERLMELDICFIPTGGTIALSPLDAKYLVNEIKPKLVVPMHFDTRDLNFTLLPLTEFTKVMPNVMTVDDWRVELTPEEIPSETSALVMQYWPGVPVP